MGGEGAGRRGGVSAVGWRLCTFAITLIPFAARSLTCAIILPSTFSPHLCDQAPKHVLVGGHERVPLLHRGTQCALPVAEPRLHGFKGVQETATLGLKVRDLL